MWRQQGIDLVATMLAAQAPFTEVFAVITQESVAVLAHSGPSTANHLTTIETSGGAFDLVHTRGRP